MRAEVGDTIILKANKFCSAKPNKEFIVESLSKSEISVYYRDNRTNNKCRCNRCQNDPFNKGLKCIGMVDIIVVETRIQRERDIKINQLI